MNTVEVHYQNTFASIKIANCLCEYLNKDSAIICIGTDKCIVDSLGPLIGTMLLRKNLGIDIYGTLDKPIHALNVSEYTKKIKSMGYKNILAIDACLSTQKNQGVVEVRNEPITPGKGIGKLLPEIGNVSIIGIVDSSDKKFNELIQETRLSFIYEMAEVISEGIVKAVSMNEVRSEEFINGVTVFGNA